MGVSNVKNRRKHWRDPSPMQERATHDCMNCMNWCRISSRTGMVGNLCWGKNGGNRREYHKTDDLALQQNLFK